MSLNKYSTNIKNYPQFSLGVDTINCTSINTENNELPFPIVSSFQKDTLTVSSSSFLVSDLSDLTFDQPGLGKIATVYFKLDTFDLAVQTFDIILDNFLSSPKNAVVTGTLSDVAKNLNYLYLPKIIQRNSTTLEINFICNDIRPGRSSDLIGNLIIRY